MAYYSLQRRKLLKAALLASILVPFTPVLANNIKNKKILIIGAGISGLSAARKLHNSGADVVILEAKPYIGGRLHTDYSLGAPFEEGAGWIHGPSAGNPIAKLARSINAKTVITDNESLAVFNVAGKKITDQQLKDIDTNLQKLIMLIDDEIETQSQASLYQAIKYFAPSALKDAGVMWALSAYAEFSKAGSIENLSAVFYDEDEAFKGADVVVATGYDKILAPLANGLNIKHNAQVYKVEYGNNGVSIKSSIGVFSADYVICSVPLGALKKQTIEFVPPLPKAHQAAIEKIGFGSITKIALKFSRAFWDIEEQYFGIQTAAKGRWNYWANYRRFSDENILLGFSMGNYAFKADMMDDEAMKQDALEVLRNVWGAQVTKPIDMRTTHWSLDPHTLGAYSYTAAGCRPADYITLAQPVNNRLFLVGEHTIFKYTATTHGAYLSGIQAADKILEL